MDCEGPGIIEDSLRRANYKITYHDAYKKSQQLVPESQQIFDLIVLMGGPKSVYDPKEQAFFKPYIDLVENAISIPGKKVLGICLGAQILAKALGATVEQGSKGQESGFSNVSILNSSHPVFKGIKENQITAFHLHGDTFNLPQGTEH